MSIPDPSQAQPNTGLDTWGELEILPSAAPVRVKLDGLRGPLSASWFNPRTGKYIGPPSTAPASGVHTFTPPEEGDWVLVLQH